MKPSKKKANINKAQKGAMKSKGKLVGIVQPPESSEYVQVEIRQSESFGESAETGPGSIKIRKKRAVKVNPLGESNELRITDGKLKTSKKRHVKVPPLEKCNEVNIGADPLQEEQIRQPETLEEYREIQNGAGQLNTPNPREIEEQPLGESTELEITKKRSVAVDKSADMQPQIPTKYYFQVEPESFLPEPPRMLGADQLRMPKKRAVKAQPLGKSIAACELKLPPKRPMELGESGAGQPKIPKVQLDPGTCKESGGGQPNMQSRQHTFDSTRADISSSVGSDISRNITILELEPGETNYDVLHRVLHLCHLRLAELSDIMSRLLAVLADPKRDDPATDAANNINNY